MLELQNVTKRKYYVCYWQTVNSLDFLTIMKLAFDLSHAPNPGMLPMDYYCQVDVLH